LICGSWFCIQITERLRDPRGLRKGALSAPILRNNSIRQRPFIRPVSLFPLCLLIRVQFN
jgi:hypothetical protein